MKLNGWNLTGIIGFVRTLQEFVLPDPVPDAIEALIKQNIDHPEIGLLLFLKAILFLWLTWGIISLIIGFAGSIWMMVRSSQSN